MDTSLEPKEVQQLFLDFKKVVDKYFSPETYSPSIFDNGDMSDAIEEMATICQKFGRQQKEKENENHRSDGNSI